jgi:predicted membrane protein
MDASGNIPVTIKSNISPRELTPFWFSDPSILFTDGNFYRIIPTSQMNTVEILNSLSLLLIYMIIILLLFSCTKLVFLPLVGLILIALYYYAFYRNRKVSNVSKVSKVKDTVERFEPVSRTTIYSEKISQRNDQSVSISDRESFTDFVYRLTPTCKEDPAYCNVYSDIRYSRENLGY